MIKSSFLVCLFLLYTFNNLPLISATLTDGIVTLSWSPSENRPIIDRILSTDTRIQLKILCRDPAMNTSATQEQIRKKLYTIDKDNQNVKIKITGRIGRIVGCLPLQSDFNVGTPTTQDEKETQRNILQISYEELWKEMEQRTFEAHQDGCDLSGTYMKIDFFSNTTGPEIKPEQAAKLKKQQQEAQVKITNTKNQKDKKTRVRRADPPPKVGSPLAQAVRDTTGGGIRTWADGYYVIEINQPDLTPQSSIDVDVIVAMRNRHNGYLAADEYPSLVFYGVMCAIYAFFAILWFVWCAFYWRELLKIQFWIGGVILIGMIEKSGFLAEYDTANRHGFTMRYAIVTAEVLSCLKRTVSRMLVIIVALGYGIVKPRLGPLKQKVIAMGVLYFTIATTEALLRLNAKHDETNNRVLVSRIPLAVVDATIYYWIFTGLVKTTRTLRVRKNLVKLNVYRHFTNTILFAIIASILFMIWSLKSHFFMACITNWREFWVDDAFWHILFSLILLVIMFLFRPSNNNQRYAFVPLLDQSDDNEDDDFGDGDEEKGESAVFDSVTMRKATTSDSGSLFKSKKQQQAALNREANVSGGNGTSGNGAVEDALSWVEDNIPTSIADQALQALDSEDEIVNTKLERSKMQ